jgi:hypothetical protein
MPTTSRSGRLAVQLTCALAGLAYLAIGLARSDYAIAFGGLAIMLAYAAFLALFGRRSETVALLGGDASDERRREVTLRATAVTGQVLVFVLAFGAMVSIAAGSRYTGLLCGLCALGGVVFVASTAWFARRG